MYVRAFPDNGNQWQISNAGGVWPVWSRNGHELFYRTEDQRIMVASYTVKGGSFGADKPMVWSGKQLANFSVGGNFDLAPDGKRFIVFMSADSPEPEEARHHVMLVTNIFEEVRRRITLYWKCKPVSGSFFDWKMLLLREAQRQDFASEVWQP